LWYKGFFNEKFLAQKAEILYSTKASKQGQVRVTGRT